MLNIEHLRIAISYRCNLKCQHCYVAKLEEPAGNESNESFEKDHISVPRIIQLMNQLIQDHGLKKISLSGGEPLYSKVWPRTKPLLAYAAERNLEIQFNTSGAGDIGIDELIAATCGKTAKLSLHVSLDGVNEAKIDKFRGKSGSAQKALNFIKTAVGKGLCVRVRYTVTSENLDEVLPCYDLVSDIGVDAFLIKPMFPSGSALENLRLLVGAERYKAIQYQLVSRSVTNSTRCDFPQPVFIDPIDIPAGAKVNILKCNCGSHAFYLSFNGDIYPCTYLVGLPECSQYMLGNITDPNFNLAEAWSNPNTFQEYRKEAKTCPSYEILTSYLVKCGVE